MSQSNPQVEAHLHHGKRLHGAGRLAEAGQVYQQVLSAAPSHPDALHMMGVLLLQTGRPDQALEWIDRALAAKNAAVFHVHRAHALLGLGRAMEAAEACRSALRLKRTDAEAHQALGHALTDIGDYESALKAYQDAIRLNPKLPDLLNNLGVAQHHTERLEEAARTLTRAMSAAPRDPGPLINLSSVQRDLGQFDAAETRLAAALRLTPDNPLALYNQALLRLSRGQFQEAWPGWEARFSAGAVPDRGLGKPLWRGEPLHGRTLLIHAEQGLGDTIQFCRFPFPPGGKVMFEVPPRLARLLAGSPHAGTIIRRGDPLPPFDLTCPLMSLPAIYGTDETSIPAAVPYLAAEPGAVARWRDRIGTHGFRIGIAWQGNKTRREDIGRSIPLRAFAPLADVPGTRLISLQKDEGIEQLTDGMKIETLGADFDSGPDGFIDTAAVMMNLDLIISSDTAVPHLAGALGRPVWVALKTAPDWRWMTGRADSPWYPSMRLFRQTTRGEWTGVFAAMKAALETRHG